MDKAARPYGAANPGCVPPFLPAHRPAGRRGRVFNVKLSPTLQLPQVASSNLHPSFSANSDSGFSSFPKGRKRAALKRWFDAGVGRLHCLPWDADTGLEWAELLARLRTAGKAMPIKDSLIAASAVVHGLAVVTRNRADFGTPACASSIHSLFEASRRREGSKRTKWRETQLPARKSPSAKSKSPTAWVGLFCFKPGNFLLSHTLARAVPSGLRGLTSVFGMGTGGSLSLWSPRNRDRHQRRHSSAATNPVYD